MDQNNDKSVLQNAGLNSRIVDMPMMEHTDKVCQEAPDTPSAINKCCMAWSELSHVVPYHGSITVDRILPLHSRLYDCRCWAEM